MKKAIQSLVGRAYGVPAQFYYFYKYRREHDRRIEFNSGFDPESVYKALCSYGEIHGKRWHIDPARYRAWLTKAKYPSNVYRGNFYEKTLEHYITVELLDLKVSDIMIDVASSYSAFPDVIERTVGCKIYEQDMIYPPGISGRKIGSDAIRIPLPDSSVDKMTLHCSFEHFEVTADSGFISECKRLLRPGGKCAIVPLYVAQQRLNLSNPMCKQRQGLIFDSDTPLIQDPHWAMARFARFYDVQTFKERILPFLGAGLRADLYYVENPTDVHESCYVKFALLLEKR